MLSIPSGFRLIVVVVVYGFVELLVLFGQACWAAQVAGHGGGVSTSCGGMEGRSWEVVRGHRSQMEVVGALVFVSLCWTLIWVRPTLAAGMGASNVGRWNVQCPTLQRGFGSLFMGFWLGLA